MDNFGDGLNPDAGANGAAGPTYAFPTLVTNALGHQARTQYDYTRGVATGAKDPNGIISRVEYDPLGRPVRATSAVGLAVQAVAEMSYPTASENVATVSRQLDSARWLASKTEFDGFGRPVLTASAEDGRKATASDVNFTVFAKTVHDALGRVKLTTGPYRAQAAPTDSWTRATYDLAGRVTEVATFAAGGSSPPPDVGTNGAWTGSVFTAYDGERTTVRDQANKQRRSTVDGLGRLKSVDEMLEHPSPAVYATTTYDYDARGNLTAVHQGQQTRSFVYDGRSRLILARNPEQGATLADARASGLWSLKYTYDSASNQEERVDARGVTAAYGYDGLNRNTTVTYTGETGTPTPNVTRFYDGATFGKERLWTTESAQTMRTTIEAYDAAGRPRRQTRQFRAGAVWGEVYPVSYTYDLAGNVKTQTYPSERVVSYDYDAAGRLNGFAGNLGDWVQRTYSTGIAYDAAGRVRQEKFGTQTPVYNKRLYNSRGQLAEIRVSTHSLFAQGQETNWNRGAIINHYSTSGWGATGGGPDNNGNLLKQEVFIPKSDGAGYDQGGNYDLFSQNFTYDALNRLRSVSEGSQWHQQYDYDRWGNRTINAAATQVYGQNPGYIIPEPQFELSPQTNWEVAEPSNRLYAPGDAARAPSQKLMRYDPAGNLVHDAYTGDGARVYDAESRMTAAIDHDAGWASYVYDADGRRVKRKAGVGAEVWQVYGVGGELLAEYAANASHTKPRKEYGYRGGELLVTAESPTRYNVALASNGATATAQNHTQDGVLPGLHFQPSYANDGVRYATTQGDHYWRQQGLPSWLEVDFGGQMTIDEVDVYTLANHPAYTTQADPSATQTFTQYGVTAFEVQYLSGADWVTVPGGSVTGNNKVWRKLSFPAVVTSKVRVLIHSALAGRSRIVELEAWGTVAGNTTAEVRWVVTDQLGTPRMVVDETGSLTSPDGLSGMRRHDYLPFGEELGAGVGGRTAGQGYSGDSVRQQFTKYERDDETGLDFAQARYYSSTMGRFTSVDPVVVTPERFFDPQQFNLYAYTRNNPLRFIDPTGESLVISGTIDEIKKQLADILQRSSVKSDIRGWFKHCGYKVASA